MRKNNFLVNINHCGNCYLMFTLYIFLSIFHEIGFFTKLISTLGYINLNLTQNKGPLLRPQIILKYKLHFHFFLYFIFPLLRVNYDPDIEVFRSEFLGYIYIFYRHFVWPQRLNFPCNFAFKTNNYLK